jgi:hypothetical protein
MGFKGSLCLGFSGFGGERLRFSILQDNCFLLSAAFARLGLKLSAIGLSDNKPSSGQVSRAVQMSWSMQARNSARGPSCGAGLGQQS